MMTTKIPGAFTNVANLYHDSVARKALALESVAGFATIPYGPLPSGAATPTGLANDSTAYTASVDIDGTPNPVSIVGSAAQTFTTLITELNADLSGATAALVGGDIVITSDSTGVASSIVVEDTDLFKSVQGTNFGQLGNRSEKGHVKYLVWDKMDDFDQGEVARIMKAIDPTATEWSFANDVVTVTGTGVNAFTPVGIAKGDYSLKITVNSIAKEVVFTVPTDMNFQQLVDDAFLPALQVAFPELTAYLTVGVDTMDIVVETTVAGNVAAAAPTVEEGTTGGLIAAIDATTALGCAVGAPTAGVDGSSTLDVDGTPDAGFQAIEFGAAIDGATDPTLANGTYNFKVTIDGGAVQDLSVEETGTDLDTVTKLVAAMNAEVVGGTVTLDDANDSIVVTSDSTGLTSTVLVADGDTGGLFAALASALSTTVAPGTAVPGTAGDNWGVRLGEFKSFTGFPVLGQVGTVPLFERENKPFAKGWSFNNNAYIYYDGSDWLYYDTDQAV